MRTLKKLSIPQDEAGVAGDYLDVNLITNSVMATTPNFSALIIDDDKELCKMLSLILNKEGYKTYVANDGNTGLAIFTRELPTVVLLDVRMPGMDGIEVLKQIKKISSDTPVIIVTAYGKVQSAVEAIKLGAYDYISKPCVYDEFVLTVQRAIKERVVSEEVHALKTQFNQALPMFEQMGSSAEVVKIHDAIERVAQTNFTVVLFGETGSGKEVVARCIHHQSPRKDKPFIVVDCGSTPETLIESELFGYEKGAFTGADRKKMGFFENASGGTLFFDEIGNLPMTMQNKLLRTLQERRIRPVGGDKEIEVDVRIITAGNERLDSLVKSGRFRMDLYQRLNEYHIDIPPLRQRKDDIVFLSMRFLRIVNRELGKEIRGFTKDAVEMLMAYDWPGNVRELRNVVRRAALLASDIIEPAHLPIAGDKPPALLLNTQGPQQTSGQTSEGALGTNKPGEKAKQDFFVDFDNGKEFSLQKCIESVEKDLIEEALKRTNGNKRQASKILKIDYKTMHYKVKEYGIKIQTTAEITSDGGRG